MGLLNRTNKAGRPAAGAGTNQYASRGQSATHPRPVVDLLHMAKPPRSPREQQDLEARVAKVHELRTQLAQQWPESRDRLLADPTTPPSVTQAVSAVNQALQTARQEDQPDNLAQLQQQHTAAGIALDRAVAEGHGATLMPAIQQWLSILVYSRPELTVPAEEQIENVAAAAAQFFIQAGITDYVV